jgi:Zn-dependent peptidase ImmA (M78 family)
MAAKPHRLSLEREWAITALAGDLAASRFPAGRVEPEEIARTEGIEFRYESFPEEFDGILIHDAGRYFIVCNSRKHGRGSPRSRFTFAHELGHYHLPEHREALARGTWPAHYSRTEFSSDSWLEMEADVFAANLLLPEKAFREKAAALPPGLDQVARLANAFGTSFTSTAYRALALDLFPAPAAIFRWNEFGDLTSRRMSGPTAWRDPDYCGLIDTVPPGSLTARAVANLVPGSAQGRSHVMDWFPNLSGYGAEDQVMLREEVKSLGQFGWITLVYAQA